MLILFLSFGILIWITLNQNELKFFDLTKLVEKDYLFLISKVSKRRWQRELRDRVLISLICSLLGLLMGFDSLVILALFFGSYYLQYKWLQYKYKKKLEIAVIEFPFLLDKLAALIQTNSVPVSISKVIHDAPGLFQDDLISLLEEIHQDGTSIKPYVNFADKYPQIEDLQSIMRSLYSLTITVGNRDSIITTFCNLTNTKIKKRIEKKAEQVLDHQNLFCYLIYASMGLLIFALFTSINFLSA